MDRQLKDELEQMLKRLLEERGFELVDLLYKYEARRLVLRILVDRPMGGITLDECAMLNNHISEILDTKDLIKESYMLEVCSPGLDRPLKTWRDFRRCINKKASVYLNEPLKAKIQYTGLIRDVDGNFLYLDIGGQGIEIPVDRIIKAKQIIEE